MVISLFASLLSFLFLSTQQLNLFVYVTGIIRINGLLKWKKNLAEAIYIVYLAEAIDTVSGLALKSGKKLELSSIF